MLKTRRLLLLLTLILTINLFIAPTAFASPSTDIATNQAIITFPNAITFSATIQANANITSVILEYGTNQLTCGEVIAKAFPQFTPGTSVDVAWTWEMRQSGSLPPGATIWWRWRYVDETGQETLSDQQTITWLDSEYDWQTVSAENLNLHWYSGDQTFAQDLLQAAVKGLDFNRTKSGLVAESPIDLYIYANTNDLKDAILYEPSWTGGLAFPAHDIVILGISQSQLDWGRDSIVHELTHVLVGHLTFSCLGGVPTWLNEGLAVYSEGELDAGSQNQLDEAIKDNTLLTIRSMSTGFSEIADKALLSYSQSYSVVKFLIETYGQDNMIQLLTLLRDGVSIDDALTQIYGFDVEGLDNAWRESVGAPPNTPEAKPTAQAAPTYVPTIVPISGVPLVDQINTPTPIPTSSFGEQSETESAKGRPPLSLTLALLGMCCVFILLIGIVILGFIIRRGNKQGGNDNV